MTSMSTVEFQILCCYYNTSELGKTLSYKGLKQLRLGFSLQGFCVLYIILSKFLTKDVLKCIVNPTYLIEYCDCTLINLVLKTVLLIFNITNKMGCCEYWYCLG